MQDERILFKNKTLPTSQNFKEMYFHYFLLRPSAIVVFAILASYFIFAATMVIYFLLAQGTVHINYIVTGGIFLLLLIYRPIQYRSYTRSAEAAFGDRPDEMALYITDGEILNEAFESIFPLRTARRAYVTKNLIYLIGAGKRIVFLCRDGFSAGEENEFIKYLLARKISVCGKI